MGRFPQPSGGRGSLKDIQVLVNDHPALFTKYIKDKLDIQSKDIEWVSPLAKDDFAEYRDGDFLNRVGINQLKIPLHDFWPKNGPQWDALGKGSDKEVFLVEAKAHIDEIVSSCGAKSPKSRKRIKRRFKETRDYLKCKPSIDWSTGLYQYANRIAHLYFLRHLNKINAYLIFVSFVNDTTHITTSREAFEGALQLEKNLLGLSKHKLTKYIAEIFIPAP